MDVKKRLDVPLNLAAHNKLEMHAKGQKRSKRVLAEIIILNWLADQEKLKIGTNGK